MLSARLRHDLQAQQSFGRPPSPEPKLTGAEYARRERLTLSKAELLASRIRDYWRKQGVVVRVWLEPLGEDGTEFVVRSTISSTEPAR